MIKTKVQIIEHEDKTSKPKPGKAHGFDYTRFRMQYSDNSTKWATAFPEVADELKKHENKVIIVDLAENERGFNIKGFELIDDSNDNDVDIDTIDKLPEPTRKSVKGSAYEKDPVGLAVEIYCSNKEDTMADCIDAVKQAQKAFS